MTSAALIARPLPNYTKFEELLNSLSHAFGAVFGIFVLVSCVAASSSVIAVWGSVVYGASMILLYAASSVYHGVNPANRLTKQILRIVDHCTIYILIAGTYTPVVLNAIFPVSPVKAVIVPTKASEATLPCRRLSHSAPVASIANAATALGRRTAASVKPAR